MSSIEKVMGFDVGEESFLDLQTRPDIKKKKDNKIMEEEMVQAILSKDLEKVEELLEDGFKIQGTLGGKRTSQLAFENFDEKIVEKLLENGMHLAYISSLLKIGVTQNNMDMMRYLEKNHGNKLTGRSWEMATLESVRGQRIEMIEFIIEKKKFSLRSWHLRERNILFMMGIVNEKVALVEEAIKNENLNKYVQKHYPSNKNFISNNLSRNITYKQCLFLNKMLGESKEFYKAFKESFPVNIEYVHMDSKLKDLAPMSSLIIDGEVSEIKKPEIKNLLDLMVYHGSDAVGDIVKSAKGAKLVGEVLKSRTMLFCFLTNATHKVKESVLTNIPFLLDVKDNYENNIAHYVLANSPTQMTADIFLKLRPELLTQENINKKAPISSMEFEKMSKVSRKMIHKEIKTSRKEDGLKIKNKKSKKRMI